MVTLPMAVKGLYQLRWKPVFYTLAHCSLDPKRYLQMKQNAWAIPLIP